MHVNIVLVSIAIRISDNCGQSDEIRLLHESVPTLSKSDWRLDLSYHTTFMNSSLVSSRRSDHTRIRVSHLGTSKSRKIVDLLRLCPGPRQWNLQLYALSYPPHPHYRLYPVPALIGRGKGEDITSAGWQVTLCDPIWHVSSRSGEVCYITAIAYAVTLLCFSASMLNFRTFGPQAAKLYWSCLSFLLTHTLGLER